VLPANDGSRYDADSVLGKKPMLLYFFATWYADAASELAMLQTLSEKYPSIAFVAVSIDGPEARGKVDAFVTEHKIKLPVLLDPKGLLLEVTYTGLAVAPQTLLISKEKKLVATRGEESSEEVSLEALLGALQK
jgi:peroxiredoxin